MAGCNDARKWLIKIGFKCFVDTLRRPGNLCNWYACRRTAIAARECECNTGKTMQIVIHPYAYEIAVTVNESFGVSIVGEAGSLWFDLKAYSMNSDELKTRLGDVEAMLVRAWNALVADK